MTEAKVLRAYRNLYRHGLRAVHHSSPARFTLRDTMRRVFRTEPADALDPLRVERTLQFLKHAELESGTEHKILKNLLHTRWWQAQRQKDNKLVIGQSDLEIYIRSTAFAQFEATLAMFNDSQQLCLR